MLLKIKNNEESHLIETRGRVSFGSAVRGDSVLLRARQQAPDDMDEDTKARIEELGEPLGRIVFQMRQPGTNPLDERSWYEVLPDLMFIDLDAISHNTSEDTSMALAWANFTDAGDDKEKLAVFHRAYLMNDSGKTIEVLE